MDNQQLLAIIVDSYLRDNNFSQTRTTFRNEAASFIFDSTITNDDQLLVNELSLDKILDDLMFLNEEKLMLNETQKLLQCMESIMYSYYKSVNKKLQTGVKVDHQERFLMEQEKYQINLLVFRMQSLINNYGIESNQKTNILMSSPLPNANSSVVPQPKLGNRLPLPPLRPNPNYVVLPTGVTTPSAKFSVPQAIITDPTTITTMQKTPNVLSVSAPLSNNAKNGNFSTHVMSDSNRKRKENEAKDVTSIGKKSCGRPPSGKIPVQGQNTLPRSNNVVNKQIVCDNRPNGPQVQGSSVVICLPVSKTPIKTTSCQSDADIFDIDIFRVPPCNSEAKPNLTNRVVVSPQEHMDYIKSSNCISPNRTYSDKGSKKDLDASDIPERLDKLLPNEFSTYEYNKQNDLPELANLTFDDDNDDLGTKFSLFDDNDMRVMIGDDDILADFLNDNQDLPCKGVNVDHSKDNASRSSHECNGGQVISELLPPTVAKVL